MNFNKMLLIAALFAAPVVAMERQDVQARLKAVKEARDLAAQEAAKKQAEMDAEAQHVLDALSSQLNDACAQKATLEAKLAGMQQERDELDSRCKAQEAKINALNGEISKLTAKIGDLENVINDLKAEIDGLQRENALLKQQNRKLHGQYEELLAVYKELNISASDLKRLGEILHGFDCNSIEEFSAVVESYRAMKNAAQNVVKSKGNDKQAVEALGESLRRVRGTNDMHSKSGKLNATASTGKF